MEMSSDSTIAVRLAEAEEWKFAGRHDYAIEILEEILFDDPQNVIALEEIAENELYLHHHDRALRAARRVLRLTKESYIAQYVTGCVLLREHKWQIALRYLKKANALEPNNPEILRCLGRALYGSGDRTDGVVTLERALNLDPENVRTLCTLASVRLHGGSPKRARQLYLQALTIDPRCKAARTALKDARLRKAS